VSGRTRNSGISCADCEVGIASGHGQGRLCPFVGRARPAGDLLYLQGLPATHVWFLKRGTVVLTRESRGSSRVRAIRFPGSLLGLEALVGESYCDTARAATEVVLCGATIEGMDAWLGPHGSPARTALVLSLRASYGDVVRGASTDGNAVSRVAAWLLDPGSRRLVTALPRHMFADLLGVRQETLSRALASLAESGAVAVTRTSIEILEERLLAAIASGEVLGDGVA
jgi:CRP-like cAMP-binding protein